MGKKFHLSVLIIGGILSQEIQALSERNKDSQDLHIRHKRLIDKSPNGNKPIKIQEAPHIVNIKRNGVTICAGTILEATVILTAAHCFLVHPLELLRGIKMVYSVLSESEYRNVGTHHDIKRRFSHPDFKPPAYVHDLELFEIYPPIDLVHSPNQKISLYNGTIAPGIWGSLCGWGCTEITPRIVYPDELRSISVPVISSADCQQIYGRKRLIREANFCTHDKSKEKGSCGGDSGGPFVIDDKLAGILSGSFGDEPGAYPDVFINLGTHSSRDWLIPTIEHLLIEV